MTPGPSHHFLDIEDARLHYVSAGEEDGRPTLLVPGWPQSWFAWRHVIPLLAATGRRVYAVDPRGLGESAGDGFDLDTAVSDLIAVADDVGADSIDVAGHDVGAWIAHAMAVGHPAMVRSLALLDAAIPGVTPTPSGIPDDPTNRRSWHFGFARLDGLPELLIEGREREFLDWLFRSKTAGERGLEALDEYARLLARPGAVRAGLGYYREAFGAAGVARSRDRSSAQLPMPLLTIGASGGVGTLLATTFEERAGRLDSIVVDAGHYLPEEAPDEVADALLDFWSRID